MARPKSSRCFGGPAGKEKKLMELSVEDHYFRVYVHVNGVDSAATLGFPHAAVAPGGGPGSQEL